METQNHLQPGAKNLRILQIFVYSAVVLYVGRNVFIPLGYALLISFVLYPICVWMEKKGVGRMTATLISLSVLIIAGLLLVGLLANQMIGFLSEWPALKLKFNAGLEDLSQFIDSTFGLSREGQLSWLSEFSGPSGFNFMPFLRSTISASAFSAVLLVLVPVYSVLILYYRRHWMEIVYRIFPAEGKSSLHEMIKLTAKAYYNFIKGMVVVYAIVGTLNSIGLLLLGIPHAILFGFIASILTFIPYVGIAVGSLLPITIAWITYDSIWYPLGIIGVFVFVQYLEANIIFPLAVSRRLNVNTLVMLLAIFIGGILWGMSGMILFVPFAGIAKLIADHNPRWKTLSMILGMPSKPSKATGDALT
jgi:predicted PurR-regulated permease PerM